jgi:mycoredoxin
MDTTENTIVVYGTTWCADCVRAKRILDSQGTAYRWVNIEEDSKAATLVQQMNQGMRRVPTIVFPDGTILVEPSNAELHKQLAS